MQIISERNFTFMKVSNSTTRCDIFSIFSGNCYRSFFLNFAHFLLRSGIISFLLYNL